MKQFQNARAPISISNESYSFSRPAEPAEQSRSYPSLPLRARVHPHELKTLQILSLVPRGGLCRRFPGVRRGLRLVKKRRDSRVALGAPRRGRVGAVKRGGKEDCVWSGPSARGCSRHGGSAFSSTPQLPRGYRVPCLYCSCLFTPMHPFCTTL